MVTIIVINIIIIIMLKNYKNQLNWKLVPLKSCNDAILLTS